MVKNHGFIHDETAFRQFIDDKMENMYIYELNDNIVNTIKQAKNKFCPKNEKEQRITPETKKKWKNGETRLAMLTRNHIRKDLRQYINKQILRTIEENKGVEVMGKGKQSQMARKKYFSLKTTTTREEPLQMIQNQGSEEIPDISCDELIHSLYKMTNNMASGQDEVEMKAIKLGGTILIKKILELSNLSSMSK
ncbi:hypothetical protein HHI36_018594 [Cryptolaemus montrouzieri]|uniref:Uncharacterized protein n=1 Tax=Cryptolaemus montrouzieri TaxID=559131 RepID=A0ABD2P1L1_9CUCU